MKLDAFTQQYVETALWSSTDNLCSCEAATEDPDAKHSASCGHNTGGEPLDANYSVDDIDPATLARMVADCAAFQADNAADLDARDPSQGGHDFWLTRNGHGCGFWDGDWPEPQAKRLTDAAHAYGSYDLYVGDDGKVYGT